MGVNGISADGHDPNIPCKRRPSVSSRRSRRNMRRGERSGLLTLTKRNGNGQRPPLVTRMPMMRGVPSTIYCWKLAFCSGSCRQQASAAQEVLGDGAPLQGGAHQTGHLSEAGRQTKRACSRAESDLQVADDPAGHCLFSRANAGQEGHCNKR